MIENDETNEAYRRSFFLYTVAFGYNDFAGNVVAAEYRGNQTRTTIIKL